MSDIQNLPAVKNRPWAENGDRLLQNLLGVSTPSLFSGLPGLLSRWVRQGRGRCRQGTGNAATGELAETA